MFNRHNEQDVRFFAWPYVCHVTHPMGLCYGIFLLFLPRHLLRLKFFFLMPRCFDLFWGVSKQENEKPKAMGQDLVSPSVTVFLDVDPYTMCRKSISFCAKFPASVKSFAHLLIGLDLTHILFPSIPQA